MNLFLLNIVLAAAWVTVTAVFTPLNFAFGFAMGTLSLWLLRQEFHSSYFSRTGRVLSLIGLFLIELLLSGFRVARDVLTLGRRYRPGIVAIPLSASQDFQITLLANLITLTPGTMSVDISSDKKTIYVHAMNVGDPQELRDDIKSGFERKIMEAFR